MGMYQEKLPKGAPWAVAATGETIGITIKMATLNSGEAFKCPIATRKSCSGTLQQSSRTIFTFSGPPGQAIPPGLVTLSLNNGPAMPISSATSDEIVIMVDTE